MADEFWAGSRYDDLANVDDIARFVAPMQNVEWIEVLPFHQMGIFKWEVIGLTYELLDTPNPSSDRVGQVLEQLREAGCRNATIAHNIRSVSTVFRGFLL